MDAIERALRALSAARRSLLRATAEGACLEEFCQAIVASGAYSGAAFRYAEGGAPETPPMTAVAGVVPPFASPEAGAGVAACALPISIEGRIEGQLSLFAAAPEAFAEAELALLGELADDLGVALHGLRAGAEHARSAERLQGVERALRTLSAGNRALLRARDEPGLLAEMCRCIVELGGYHLAWVGYAEHDAHKTIRPVAHAGYGVDLFDFKEFTWADTELGQTTAATAIRSGQACTVRNIPEAAQIARRWREEARKHGFAAVASFPLRLDAEVIGNLSIFALEADAFDAAELALLGELADDLAFGIASLRTRVRQQKAEETIHRMAYYDALTELPNRSLLRERLAEAISAGQQWHTPVALLVLDVDCFRDTNEVLGFRQGDRVLCELARRLEKEVGERGLLARIGVDEFALLVPRADLERARELAQGILKSLDEPFEFAELRVELRASIGIAIFPGHGSEPDQLILRADAAMHEAKRAHSGFAFFPGDNEPENRRRLALVSELHRAIDDNLLRLYFQPKIDLRSGRVRGAEALVRWQHPEQGTLAPDGFIPLAERTGLIHALTYWVVNAALGQRYAWRESAAAMPLAVNLSARNLVDPRLTERVRSLLMTWGAGADWLEFELTESALMEDPLVALDVLRQLRARGGRIFVDDFGTGYSSLSYLQKLPLDGLKIDKSFVLGLAEKAESALIVRSTIELAHNLGLEVVAEGAASRAICERLFALGCDVAQGSYVGEPMNADDFAAWCQRRAAGATIIELTPTGRSA